MRAVKRNLSRAWWVLRKYYPYLIGAVFLYGIFFINTFHESYPDEFDNILGGRYILEGKIIYKDFFTHHGPVAYFIAALTLLFSGNSFVNFRIVYSIFLFLVSIGGYAYIRHSIGEAYTRFYIPLLYILAVASTYFWGHMLLADSISAFFLLPAFTLIVGKSIYKKRLTLWDTAFIGVLSALSFLSSLSYAYMLGFAYLYVAYYYYRSNNFSLTDKKAIISVGKFFALLAAPYMLFGVYFLATWSFAEYFYQNFTFNQMYYIYNYPRPEGTLAVNPVRYMIIIAQNFFTNFTSLLSQVPSFNFAFPYNITLALGSISFIFYLLFRRKFLLALFVILILIYSNVRSNPLESKETDYQEAVYMMFSFMAGLFTVKLLYDDLKKNTLELPQKIIFTTLFLLLSLYGIFNIFYLTRSFSEKAFGKYMGTQARIYDRPQIAPMFNDILKENEYTWVGPFEFKELFYLNNPIASRYQIYNSAQGRSGHVGQELVGDFESTKPKMIWFDKRFFILGESPEQYAQEFIEYLNSHYNTLYEYRDEEGRRFVANYPFEERVDIETKLYIRKENTEEILNRLLNKGYVAIAQNE